MQEKKNNQLQTLVKEAGLDEAQASDIVAAFGGPFEEASTILADFEFDEEGKLVPGPNAIVVTDENDKQGMEKASEYRKTVKKARTTIDNKRVELKAEFLKKGNAIQSIANELRDKLKPVEEYLETQEKFAKLLEEKRAAEKKTKRLETLGSFEVDTSIYNIDLMTDEAFDALVVKLKDDAARAKEERLAAEKKAEEEAAAERKKQEDQAAENAKLKAEADEREKAHAIVQGRINAVTSLGLTWDEEKQHYFKGRYVVTKKQILESSADDLKKHLLSINAAIENDEAVEAAKQKEIQDAEDARLAEEARKAEEDRKERERLQKEADDRAAAEAKEKADREAAEHAALLAPDKEKVDGFINKIELSLNDIPAVKSGESMVIMAQLNNDVVVALKSAREKLEKL